MVVVAGDLTLCLQLNSVLIDILFFSVHISVGIISYKLGPSSEEYPPTLLRFTTPILSKAKTMIKRFAFFTTPVPTPHPPPPKSLFWLSFKHSYTFKQSHNIGKKYYWQNLIHGLCDTFTLHGKLCPIGIDALMQGCQGEIQVHPFSEKYVVTVLDKISVTD